MSEEDKLPVKISMSNPLVQARYDFDLIEKRCLYQIIKAVRKQYIESEIPRTTFEDLTIYLTPDELNECMGGERKHSVVYKSLRKLQGRQIEINNDDEWCITSWVIKARHDKKKDVYEVKVDSSILPYLVELAANFTTLELTAALSFKSVYSQRFYELCSQYRNRPGKSFFLTVKQIRGLFKLGDPDVDEKVKYADSGALRQFVIDVAQKEIKASYEENKNLVDMWFDYRVKETGGRTGRTILSWYFFIHTRDDERQVDVQEVVKNRTRINGILSAFFKRDKKFITRVLNSIDHNPNLAQPILEKLVKKMEGYEKEDIPGIIRYVLREDFDIK